MAKKDKEDVDAELDQLLQEVASIDEDGSELLDVEKIEYEAVKIEPEAVKIEPEAVKIEPEKLEPIINPPTPHEPPIAKGPVVNPANQAIMSLAADFADTVKDVLMKSEEDRQMLSTVIHKLQNITEEMDPHSRGAASYFEHLVSAMTSKADINIQKTKLLDSVAKLLAAAKNNTIIIGPQDGGGNDDGDIDFDKLLNE